MDKYLTYEELQACGMSYADYLLGRAIVRLLVDMSYAAAVASIDDGPDLTV